MLRLGVNAVKSILPSVVNKPVFQVLQVAKPIILNQDVRTTTFLTRGSGDELWKSITCVSNAGKRRGRGQGADKRFKKNLNIGQKTGEGKVRVVWPGLTCPVIKGNTKVSIQKLDSPKETPAIDLSTFKKKRIKLHPLERGWSGTKMSGRHIKPPSTLDNGNLKNFDAIIIEHKLGRIMTSNYGSTRRFRVTVVVGNRNGLVGLGSANSKESRGGFQLAIQKALRRLVPIDLEDNVSINHDFFSSFGHTRIFAYRKPEGSGLKVQRTLKAICELAGIRNLSANIEGPSNQKHIYKAFVLGLINQKTYQQIAEENNLYVVEKVPEKFNYPNVLGAPEICLTEEEYLKKPRIFKEAVMGGRTELPRVKPPPFFINFPSYQKYLKKSLYKRNHRQVEHELVEKYGSLKSHLGDLFPECNQHIAPRKESQREEE